MDTTAHMTIGARRLPGLSKSALAGLLTGAVVGLIGAVASAPLRRLAGVSDRALVNGVSIVGGAVVLWLLLGALYGMLSSDPAAARRTILIAAAGVAVIASILSFTALSGFANRLPSLAVPLVLWVTLGGAALFLSLMAQPRSLPFQFLAPVAVVGAVAVAVLVSALDATPKVHYTLSKLPAAGNSSASGDSGAAPGAASTGTAAATGTLHFTVSSGSEAAFTVHEKLTQLPSPSDAIGKTQSITGDVYLDSGKGVSTASPSTISVDLRTLATDSSMRDGFIKMATLQTNQFPTATFTVTSIDGFPTTYTEGTESKVTVSGTLTVHGVAQPVSWTGTARYAAGQLEAVLSTDVTMTQFGMTPPQVPVVQSVDDKVHLDLHLFAQQAA